ncbi:2Fe-2S iron-sulfur cluster-binding protein [Botryobacter ruber]|uniref:2Fe-2S iron-sulfur cluster-binding protein n=1 Tax=Botryobacter ruber TaxID=2171629 RepID=UPI000E09FB94|nr:2Fe-2S iron-sulfur cluster-binding protein [Botryobacter ruber]
MPKLIVQNLAEGQVEVAPGQTLLEALQKAGIAWMFACGGKGRCTTCRLEVREGLQHVGPPSAVEAKYQENGKLNKKERLACQSTLTGPVAGVVPEDTKLPHIKYTD